MVLLLLLFFTGGHIHAQEADTVAKVFSAGGYIKELPYLQFAEHRTTTFDNIVNLRLNLTANLTKSTRMVLELRNRLMLGETYRGDLGTAESFNNDYGWLDLSLCSAVEGSNGLVHVMADRLFLEHNGGKWQFRAGRQRINWGINLVSNPNDLFNTYSFFDFDYPERPGSDAVRIQYYVNSLSHTEIAFAPADHIRDAVGAFLYSMNFKGYDVQLITGYYHDRLVIAGGWAGNIRKAGFKGEISTFVDFQKSDRQTDVVAAVSGDYLFGNSLYLVVEALYNGGYEPGEYPVAGLLRPLSADNILFSQYAVTSSVTYPFSPVFGGTLSMMDLPDIHAFFIAPSFTWSLYEDFDVSLGSQVFIGGGKSGFDGSAASLIGGLQYSF